MLRLEPENVARLARERLADRIERREADRARLAGLEDRYLALNYGQRRPGEQARPLEIAAKEVLEKVDFALSRMGIISGRVFDEPGEPIVGVTVWALRIS